MTKYKVDFLSFVTDSYVKSDCGDITFVNNGTNTVIINNSLRLVAGNSLSLSANLGEIDTTAYFFKFVIPNSSGNLLTVLRKIYV